MATNYHSNLPNDQIHNPKDFDPAHKNSVLIKTGNGELNWNPSTYTLESTITCIDDVGGTLNNSYWVLNSSNNETTYHVWYNVASAGDYFTADATLVEIAIAASDTAATIATATATVLNALSGVTAVSTTPGEILITTIFNATKPFDGANTGFGFLSTETSTGSEYLQTDVLGNIKWGAAPGGGGCSNVFSTIVTSPVSETVSASGCTDTLILSEGINTRVDAVADADTVLINACENIHFRAEASSIEDATQYVLDSSNSRDFRYIQAMSPAGTLTTSQILKAGIAIPNEGGRVLQYRGYMSAPTGGAFQLSLWRFSLECGVSAETIAGDLVCSYTNTSIGNDNALCFDMTITSLTYGDNDILVPSFMWTESGQSSMRMVGKLKII